MNPDSIRTVRRAFALAAAMTLLAATPSQAYIDPGSGSYLFQFAIAAIAGGLYALKTYWGRLRPFFSSLLSFRKRR